MGESLVYVGGVFYLLPICGHRCRIVGRMFVYVFDDVFKRRLGRGRFDVHRISVFILLCALHLDVFDIPLLRVFFSRCRWPNVSRRYCRWFRRFLDFLRYGVAKQSGLA